MFKTIFRNYSAQGTCLQLVLEGVLMFDMYFLLVCEKPVVLSIPHILKTATVAALGKGCPQYLHSEQISIPASGDQTLKLSF